MRSKGAVVAVLWAAASAVAGSASAQRQYQDSELDFGDRRVALPSTSPYLAIGRLLTSTQAVCTAWMINRCTAITAKHCFTNMKSVAAPPAGAARNVTMTDLAGRKWVGEYGGAGWNKYYERELDIAAVKFPKVNDQFPGDHMGVLRHSTAAAEQVIAWQETGGRLCAAGFPVDRNGAANLFGSMDLSLKVPAEVKMFDRTWLATNGQTPGGMSGGPLFSCQPGVAQTPEQTFVVGVIERSDCSWRNGRFACPKNGSSVAVATTAVADWLDKLAKEECR